MRIVLTVRELMERDIWETICDLKGIKVWAVNDGLIDDTEEISLTEEQARKLYLIE